MKLYQHITAAVATALLLLAVICAYSWARSRVAVNIYEQKLSRISAEHQLLREAYNTAVRETAVTELDVTDAGVSVIVRTAEGVLHTVETPFHAGQDLYVDYIVINERLWIRRVFDDSTAPVKAVVIDPRLAQIDWDDQYVEYGKAIYRRISKGRWIVTVTGNGALGLKKIEAHEPIQIAAAPSVQSFAEIQEDLNQRLDQISFSDVMMAIFGRK